MTTGIEALISPGPHHHYLGTPLGPDSNANGPPATARPSGGWDPSTGRTVTSVDRIARSVGRIARSVGR